SRRKRQRGTELLLRFGDAVALLLQRAKKVVRFGESGRQYERAPNRRLGVARLADRLQEHRQVVKDGCVIGREPQRRFVLSERAGDVTLAAQLERALRVLTRDYATGAAIHFPLFTAQ